MKLTKSNNGLLSKENVQEGDVVKIIDDVSVNVSNGRNYYNFKVECPDGSHKLAGINEFGKDKLIDALGDETSEWIGAELMVKFVTTKSGVEFISLEPMNEKLNEVVKSLVEEEKKESEIPF